MDKLLKLLDTNARLSTAQMAAMLDTTVEDIEAKMAKLEQDGVVRAYKALIDWERTDRECVTAVIELRVTPKRDYGFEGIAETIMRFDDVESVYLMSGGYDLLVTVTGRTFKEVSMFVAKRLSTLESVISTATHFVLRRYKESGVMFLGDQKVERGVF